MALVCFTRDGAPVGRAVRVAAFGVAAYDWVSLAG